MDTGVTLGDVVLGFKQTTQTVTESEPIIEDVSKSFGSHFHSNFAAKAVYDMLAIGAKPFSSDQKNLLYHSRGRPLDEVKEFFAYAVEFFKAASEAEDSLIIKLETSIWVHPGMELQEDYENTVRKFYNAHVYRENFDSREDLIRMKEDKLLYESLRVDVDIWIENLKKILKRAAIRHYTSQKLKKNVNKWIEVKVGGHAADIFKHTTPASLNPELIFPINFNTDLGCILDDTRLIVAAGLHFEAEWFETFREDGDEKFMLPDENEENDKVVNLPFMTAYGKHYIKQFPNYKLVCVPFKQHKSSNFSMLFFLPKAKEIFDLVEFISKHEDVIMNFDFNQLEEKDGEITIPKFKLNEGDALDFQNTYELENMVNSTILSSKGGRMRGFLEVSERGVIATGVSSSFIGIKSKSGVDKPKLEGPGDTKPQSAGDKPKPNGLGGTKLQSAGDKQNPEGSGNTKPQSGSDKKNPKGSGNTKAVNFVANSPFLFFIRDNVLGRMLFTGAVFNT